MICILITVIAMESPKIPIRLSSQLVDKMLLRNDIFQITLIYHNAIDKNPLCYERWFDVVSAGVHGYFRTLRDYDINTYNFIITSIFVAVGLIHHVH
jgi:hypothetical protein